MRVNIQWWIQGLKNNTCCIAVQLLGIRVLHGPKFQARAHRLRPGSGPGPLKPGGLNQCDFQIYRLFY